ncbi:hypothetical protein M8J75_009811 [Diaphorina citri]|nr:hypothetical protein M8J75_009811 [Diaphorina citri]
MCNKVEVYYALDYVCALAETLICLQCKNLPKQAHHCINCLSVYCYMCVHKNEVCPKCHAKYCDKSYLKYYELGDANVEFIYSMVNQLQKENVRLPIFIKKIVADQNIYVTSKNKFEVGNSSKQTEFPAADDYFMSVENDPNIINKQPPANETPNDSDHNGNTSNDESNDPVWIPDSSPKTSNRNRRRDKKNKVEKGKSLNVTKKTVSQTEPKCYEDPFDKLLSEQNEQKKENDSQKEIEEKIDQKKVKEISQTPLSDTEKEENEDLFIVNRVERNKRKISINLDSESSSTATEYGKECDKFDEENSNEESSNEPSSTQLRCVSKTYPNKTKNISDVHIHEKSAASIFDFDEYVEESCKATLLNKYALLRNRKRMKPKDDIGDNEDKEEDELELFKDSKKTDTKVSSRKRINQTDSKTVDTDKTEISKDKEQQSKRTRKQLGVNKNTSEIENLIRSKKLKVDKDIENEDGSTEKKEIPIDGLNPKEIDKILNEDKQLNVVPRSTRQRKNSKNEDTVKAESTKHEPSVKNPPRQARTKTLSETSTDTNVKDTNKNTNGETNEAAKTKRTTRATPRSVNKNAKTTESNIEPTKSIEPVSSEEKSITPIRKPGKRLLKPTSIPEDNSATSTSTGEYLTPLSNTPGDVATPGEGLDEGLTTPKSRHAFKVPDNNATPVAKTKKETTKKNAVKTPSTLADAKKDTATLKTPSAVATGKKDTVVKTPVTPATVKRNPLLNAMYKRNVKGETPLHMACKKDTNKVLSLLKNNMNPNVKDNAGWTPLHDAVSIGNESVVRLLLEAGALVNVPGLDNDTPLHLATRDVRPALAKLLIQYGADVDKRNIQGHKPLEYLDVIGRDDIKADILTALSLPRLSAAPPPPLPSCIDIVIYADQLDKTQTSGLAQFVKTLSSGADVPIIVSTLLQSNVNILLVNGTPERTCIATCNVLRAILSGIKAVDYTWISRSLEIGKVLPVEEFEILGTVDYPLAKPFHRSRENKENLLPGLFNGLQVYLTKPWPTSSPLSSEDMRDIFKRGGATLLNREPDPESMNLSESSVMYHVNRPQHRLYNLSQAIVYSEEALPRRLYNMEHVKALGLSWVRACVEQFEIVQPKSPYEQ